MLAPSLILLHSVVCVVPQLLQLVSPRLSVLTREVFTVFFTSGLLVPFILW
jgi:hypothetical protein